MKHIIILFLLTFYVLPDLSAQKGWELGGFVGLSQYYGDINPDLNLNAPRPSLGFRARYNFNERVSWRGGLGFGRLSGDDSKSDNNFQLARNLNFSSNIYDLHTGIEFNFFKYTHGSSDEWYTPYLFAGISALRFNPTTTLDGEKHELQPLGTEGQASGSEYGKISGSFIIGGGFKYDINYEWSVNIEFSYRNLWTDYIDDVSTIYPDLNTLESQRGAIAAALSDRSPANIDIASEGRQRGDSTDGDSVLFINIGMMRYFGKIRCPKISDIR